MTYKTLQTTFERELLYHIITNVRERRLTGTGAKEIAGSFLPLLNSVTVEEFIEKLSKLSRSHNEIREAFIVTVSKYEKEELTKKLIEVRSELRGGENS